MHWLVADTETTGVGEDDKMVEVAWCLIDDDLDVIESGHSLINPERPIAPAASAVHGLTARDVADAPTAEQYFAENLVCMLGPETCLIAHNSAFDARFLQPYIPFELQQLCTLRLARKLLPDSESHKLGSLAYEFDLIDKNDRFHSADGDVATLLRLLMFLADRAGLGLHDLAPFSRAPIVVQLMPFGKHKGTPLKDLPSGYRHWLLTTANIDDDLRASLLSL